jgi:hypothetical protein
MRDEGVDGVLSGNGGHGALPCGAKEMTLYNTGAIARSFGRRGGR